MRRFGLIAVAAAAVTLLGQGTSFAALDKCQKRIQGEGAKLQKFMYGAMQKCADAIRKEQVKAAVLNVPTNCGAGAACLINAAAFCEKQLAVVYDAANAKPNKSKIDLFRGAMEKSRVLPKQECTDDDLKFLTGMGHLLSGTGAPLAMAPPKGTDCDGNADNKKDANCGGVFMTDWLIYAIENSVVKQLLAQTPDLIGILQKTIEADSAIPAAKPETNCDNVNDPGYRPNLCRWGMSCRTAVCNIDQTQSMVSLQVPQFEAPYPAAVTNGPVDIPVAGSMTTEVCRPGPTGTGVSGLGLGAAFGAAPDTVYLINSGQRGLYSPMPLNTNVSLLDTMVKGVCIEVVGSQGWCDCKPGGQGVTVDAQVCVDKNVNISNPTDRCGGPTDQAVQQSSFPHWYVSPVTITPSGASAAGDCVDQVTLQLKLSTNDGDKGADGVWCTDDDLTAPLATFTFPLTTGKATAKVYDTIWHIGWCDPSNNPCLDDADCPQGEYCVDQDQSHPDYVLGPVTGSKPVNACAQYATGSLSGVGLVSAVAYPDLAFDLGGPYVVDGLLNFKLKCQ